MQDQEKRNRIVQKINKILSHKIIEDDVIINEEKYIHLYNLARLFITTCDNVTHTVKNNRNSAGVHVDLKTISEDDLDMVEHVACKILHVFEQYDKNEKKK